MPDWLSQFVARDGGLRGALLRAYTIACVGVTALLVGLRWAHYAFDVLPDWLRYVGGASMRVSVLAFPWYRSATAIGLVSCLVLFVSRLVWRRGFYRLVFRGTDPRPPVRQWVWAFLASLLLVHHYFLDADPFITKIWMLSLPLLAVAIVPFAGREPTSARRAAAAVLFGLVIAYALYVAPNPSTQIAIALWGGSLPLLGLASLKFFRPALALVMAMGLVPLCCSIVPATLPLVMPSLLTGGPEVIETRGYAYGYCEIPATNTLFMSVPVGQTGDIERLRDGYVAEYDTLTGKRRAEHYLFDESFYGGLRLLYCLNDRTVQLTMNGVFIDGAIRASNVLEFPAADPSQVRQSIFTPQVREELGWDLLGHIALYDSELDTMYYMSEWSSRFFRRDRKSGELDTHWGDDHLPFKEPGPTVFGPMSSPTAVHPERRTIYFSEWVDGSILYEVDLDSPRVARRFQTYDTGTFGIAIDFTHDRLFSSALWGLNVIDLGSGEILLRLRTGPGARAAVIDDPRDLVYISTTFGGLIWVLDQNSLEVLGQISVGFGGRPGYLSLNGRHLYASNQDSVLRWDAEKLARSFRGDCPSGRVPKLIKESRVE